MVYKRMPAKLWLSVIPPLSPACHWSRRQPLLFKAWWPAVVPTCYMSCFQTNSRLLILFYFLILILLLCYLLSSISFLCIVFFFLITVFSFYRNFLTYKSTTCNFQFLYDNTCLLTYLFIMALRNI